VPSIEGLSVQDLLQYAKSKPLLLRYLPSEKDWLHIDKSWLCDVLYTLDQEGLDNLVNAALQHRKLKLD
jgi:hypothetical protein